MYWVTSLGAIARPLASGRNAGWLSQYPRTFSLAPLWLLAARIGRAFRRAYDRAALHSWVLHSILLVHIGEPVERRRCLLASPIGSDHLWESTRNFALSPSGWRSLILSLRNRDTLGANVRPSAVA